MITLDDAVRLFESKELHTLPARDRAVAEAFIWQSTPKTQRPRPDGTRRRGGIAEYFVENGAESMNEVKCRHQLYRALDIESLLWDEVEKKGMSLRTAVRILEKARELQKKTGGGIELAVKDALDEYHGPHMESRKSHAGSRYKVRSKNIRPKGAGAVFARGAAHTKLFTDIRAAVASYLALALAGLPEHEANDARLEVLGEFDLTVLAAARIVGRIHHRVEEPKREAVRDACYRLGIAAPYNGRAPDMQAAKRAYRSLVLQLHPDRRGGADDTREALEATIVAYTTLEEYTHYLNSKKEKETVSP